MFKDMPHTRYQSHEWESVTPQLLPFLQMLPLVFDSVKQARQYWDLIVEATMLWRASSHPNGFSTLGFGENNIRASQRRSSSFSQRIKQELQVYMTTTEGWLQSFQPLFERSRAQKGTKEFLGASILMIKYLSWRFTLPRLEQCDTYEDEFLPGYITVVDLAQGLLEADLTNRIKDKPIFIFDDRLVAGLFLVATGCRERRVRRQAINLLRKYPRREGLWDSSMAAKVATWFMEAEEEGLEGDSIPPSARLNIVKNDFVLSERKAVVRCSKIFGTATLPEVTLTW